WTNCRVRAQAMAQASSCWGEEFSGTTVAVTPQQRASRRATWSLRVRARTAAVGLRLLSARAVRPESVETTISAASSRVAARQAAATTASVIGLTNPASEAGTTGTGPGPVALTYASASAQICRMVRTASSG